MEKYNMMLPVDLKLAFKIKAAKENKTMTEILTEFIKSYVGLEKQKEAA